MSAATQLNIMTVYLQKVQGVLEKRNSPTPLMHLYEAGNFVKPSPELAQAAIKRLRTIARLEAKGLRGPKLNNLKQITLLIRSRASRAA